MAALGRRTTEPTPESIQKMLDENAQLIQAIVENQNKGRAFDAMQYQQILYRNLSYLASLADPTMNIRDLLPKPNLYMQQGPPAQGYSMQSGVGVGQRPPVPSTSQGTPYTMGMPNSGDSANALQRQTMGQVDLAAGHYPPPGASRAPPPQGGYQPALPTAVNQGHPPGISPQQQEEAMKQQMAMQMQQHAQMMHQQLDHMGGAPSSSMPPPSYGQHRGPGQF